MELKLRYIWLTSRWDLFTDTVVWESIKMIMKPMPVTMPGI